jgi:hypothetical protein
LQMVIRDIICEVITLALNATNIILYDHLRSRLAAVIKLNESAFKFAARKTNIVFSD